MPPSFPTGARQPCTLPLPPQALGHTYERLVVDVHRGSFGLGLMLDSATNAITGPSDRLID